MKINTCYPLCKDCKHSKCNLITGFIRECAHPKLTSVDYSTGKIVRLMCSTNRKYSCGKEAIYFGPKKDN